MRWSRKFNKVIVTLRLSRSETTSFVLYIHSHGVTISQRTVSRNGTQVVPYVVGISIVGTVVPDGPLHADHRGRWSLHGWYRLAICPDKACASIVGVDLRVDPFFGEIIEMFLGRTQSVTSTKVQRIFIAMFRHDTQVVPYVVE